MNNITINNLNIHYDDLVVLQNFNAKFDTGIHWIQGLNGLGKSSLLKSLCGIVPITDNVVSIMGNDIKTAAFKAKSELCFVPDKPEVYPFMTGMGFLKLLAKIKGVTLTSSLFNFMKKINLTPYKDILFSEMSFGTRRKFTLCSVFIGNPKVVLLDEPFNGLDKLTIKELTLWLKHVKKDKCILVVSHDTHILKDLHSSITLLG